MFELYVHFAMSGTGAVNRTQVVNCRRPVYEAVRLEQLKRQLSLPADEKLTIDVEAVAALATFELNKEAAVEMTVEDEPEDTDQYSEALSALATFDVKQAHCFSKGDEEKLRRVIESESAEAFNVAIREAGAALHQAANIGPINVPISASSSTTVGNYDTTENPVSGTGMAAAERVYREDFDDLDTNNDGRLCAIDLLRACGSKGEIISSATGADMGSSSGWMSHAQATELLECIATGPEIRVNGSLSIGFEEYKAWMCRSK